MPRKLFISDDRMLQLMEWAIRKGIAQGETDYLEKIDFARNSMPKVRQGIQGFTKIHILNACKLTGASADWIFGLTNNMMRKPPARAIDLLKQAVTAVEQEIKVK
jgi:hypothetical protein